MESPQSTRSVSWLNTLSFSTGHVMNDMCASMWFTYLLIFFHRVLYFENIYAGVVLLAGQIADGLSTLFVGFFLDSGDDFFLCNRYGTRKSWHLVGTLCVLSSFLFVFMPCLAGEDTHHKAQLVYYVSFVIIFQIGWAAVQISHLSMIPVLSDCDHQRTRLTSARYSATVLSNTAVYCVTWLWLGIKDNHAEVIDGSDVPTFRNVAIICLSVGGASSLIFHLTVDLPNDGQNCESLRESPPIAAEDSDLDENNDVVLDDEEPIVPGETEVVICEPMGVRDWLKEPQFYQVAMVYMTTRLYVNVTQSYMPFYLQETIMVNATYVATIPLVMYLSGFVVSFVATPITDVAGRKLSFAIACLIGLAGCVWVHFGDIMDDNFRTVQIYPVAVLIGAGGSFMLITSLSITADLIGNNLDSSAFIYGCMSLCDKVSNGATIMVIQKYIPTHEPDGCTVSCCIEGMYFKSVMSWICGSIALFGVFSVITLLPFKIGDRRRDARRRRQQPLTNSDGDQLASNGDVEA